MDIEIGDRFPTLTAPVLGGGSLTVPDDLDRPAILLFYRGHW